MNTLDQVEAWLIEAAGEMGLKFPVPTRSGPKGVWGLPEWSVCIAEASWFMLGGANQGWALQGTQTPEGIQCWLRHAETQKVFDPLRRHYDLLKLPPPYHSGARLRMVAFPEICLDEQSPWGVGRRPSRAANALLQRVLKKQETSPEHLRKWIERSLEIERHPTPKFTP